MAAANIVARAASSVAWFLARYMSVVFFFYMLSMGNDRAGFIARMLASWMSLILSALYGVFASIALRLAGRSGIAQWATGRCFKYAMALTAGITFRVSDPKGHLDRVRPAVFVGNHQTAVDVLMLGCMFPKYCSVTAKTSLRWYPFLGWFMQLSGTVFIDRKNSRDARQAMSGAAEAIRARRQSVFMFPEGTRSNAQEPMLLNFKKGAFHLAVQAQVPIVPVVVANYSHVYSYAKMRFRAGAIPVKVLDPIPTAGLKAEDVEELTRTTRELMLKELVELTAQARKEAEAAEKGRSRSRSRPQQPISVPSDAATNGSAATATGVDTGSSS